MKQQRVPSLISIAILTTITIIFWVVFSVYRVLTSKPSPNIPENILEPLNPTLDEGIIAKIQKRTFFGEGQITTPSISLSPSPQTTIAPTLTPSPTSTASSTPTATASATPGG